MENTSKKTFDLDAIAWAAFFVMWGVTAMFKSVPDGLGAVGIGLILVGLNLARSLSGRPTSTFTITIGLLALLLGGLELMRPILNLSFELPVFAILLIALGVSTFIRVMKK